MHTRTGLIGSGRGVLPHKRGATIGEHTPNAAPQDQQDRNAGLQRDFDLCLKISASALGEESLDTFLRHVLSLTTEHLGADRGSIFIFDQATKKLRGYAMTGVKDPLEVTISPDEGIVGHVFRTGEVDNIKNAYEDERFYRHVDEMTGYTTRSILCAPIRSHSTSDETEPSEGKILGALELLNPKRGEPFSEADARSIERILGFVALRFRGHSVIDDLLNLKTHYQETLAQVRGYSDKGTALDRIAGSSPQIHALKQMIWSTAAFDTNVHIHGESGSGKEMVAQCLHALSGRSSRPFVAINCASIPESLQEAELFGIEGGVATGVSKRVGRIEQASGGTLFLDEIGEMSLDLQAKLLRVIQERELQRVGGKDIRPIDVRIVCATHKDLRKRAEEGLFREDLFYRLHVVEIRVPPLRERLSDVPELCRIFLKALSDRYGPEHTKVLHSKTLAQLCHHSWPGNVRQLQNEVERLFVLSGKDTEITSEHLSPELQQEKSSRLRSVSDDRGADHTKASPNAEDHAFFYQKGESLSAVLERVEKTIVTQTLAETKGNKTRTAQILGISREGLRKMLVRWEKSA